MIALITGATSGIGRATAELFAEHGYNLIVTGRRADRLNELKQQLEIHCDVLTLNFDVRDRDRTTELMNSIPNKFQPIDVLINNAGNAHGLSKIQDGNLDDWDNMMDANVKGLLYVSKPIMNQMVAQQKGHIVNIGSIAGKEVYPNGNVYCASKFAVDAISKAMRIDLNGTGVKVSQICPGLVETEFSEVRFKGDKDKAKNVYNGLDALQARDIAELIYFIITRPAHVNIADSLILPSDQASATIVHRSE